MLKQTCLEFSSIAICYIDLHSFQFFLKHFSFKVVQHKGCEPTVLGVMGWEAPSPRAGHCWWGGGLLASVAVFKKPSRMEYRMLRGLCVSLYF